VLATDARQTEPGGRRKAAGAGDPGGVRTWPWVSLNIPPGQLAEFTALAARLGRSRADLLREVLEQVGLPYARAIAASRAGRAAAGGASPRARKEGRGG
jgi:hypothetical protein